MKRLSIVLAIFMTSAAVYGDKKSDSKFSPGPASSYTTKQTNENVTIAAVAYDSDELAHTAFGKLNPYQYGVLPVLVIIQNDTGEALRLDHVTAEFVDAADRHAEAIPAEEVQYAGPGPSRPRGPSGGPLPLPPGLIKHKSPPLSAWEIEGRAFSAKMLPAHEAANGFFYFQSRVLPGCKLYLTGIQKASSGKELFYFEIPLEMHR